MNFNVLQQATLFYQGKTAFDFNSGFHIGGINANSPQLIDSIDAYPIPKIKESDKDQGIETSNIPMFGKIQNIQKLLKHSWNHFTMKKTILNSLIQLQ